MTVVTVDQEITRLAEAAVDIAQIPDPKMRHQGGFWLQGQLESVYDNHLFTEDQRLDFMAVVKIMLDVIFRDAVEDASDLKQFEVDAPRMDRYLDAAKHGL